MISSSTAIRNETVAGSLLATRLSIGNNAEATIPCFDLRDIHSLSAVDRAALIAQFGDGLRDVGFVALYAPEMTPIVEQATEVMKCYFAQDVEAKVKDIHNNNGQTGFAPMGLETAAGGEAPDLKETFFITRDMPAWPEGHPDFEPVMTAYLESFTTYADQVMTLLWEYLGENEEIANGEIYGGDMRIRLAYYPESKETDDPRSVWARRHQDLNGVTLLPRPSRSGLQLFLRKEEEWLSVLVPKDYIIVNTGDMITGRTGGYIYGTEHQVVNDDPSDKSARFATIFFASLPDHYQIYPLTSCAEKVTKGLTPCMAGAYLSEFPEEADNVSVNELRFARLIEMGSVEDVDVETIRALRSKGLIKNPCAALIAKFPQIFS